MKVLTPIINFNNCNYKINKQVTTNKFAKNSYYNPIFQTNPITKNKISPPNRKFIAEIITNFKNNNQHIEILGKGTFGTAYKISLPIIGTVVVKILNPENNNKSYGGGNLEKEAETLKKIPINCRRSQKIIDFFKQNNNDYLVTNFIEGKCLKSLSDITQIQMDNIVDELYKYDTQGLMFYDLNADNIKVAGDNIGIFDFEFVELKNPLEQNYSAFNDLHHIGRNFYHPHKSCINAFENRALGEFIINSNEDTSRALTKKYLKSLSEYHNKKAIFYSKSNTINSKAVEYEKILSRIYNKPNDEVISIEKDLIYLRSITLNYYLYLKRLANNALLEKDYIYYTDFNKFVTDINNRAKEVQNKIKNLQKSKDTDIQEYCKVNSLYINSLLKINCSKSALIIDKNSNAQKLKHYKDNILANKDFKSLEKFLEVYKLTKLEYANNPEYSKFCDDIKNVLVESIKFISNTYPQA